jgi:threonine dehydratase
MIHLVEVRRPTLSEIEAAAELIYEFMQPTPQYRWPLLSERLGTEVWVKHENQTPTDAFKARTAVVYVDELLKREPNTKGLITATRGNHGQAVALAAKRFGLPATILVPFGNSREITMTSFAHGSLLIGWSSFPQFKKSTLCMYPSVWDPEFAQRSQCGTGWA